MFGDALTQRPLSCEPQKPHLSWASAMGSMTHSASAPTKSTRPPHHRMQSCGLLGVHMVLFCAASVTGPTVCEEQRIAEKSAIHEPK
eukprot:scaffold39062_cov75-Phaeocystis_antarctica.AAC.3